MVAIEKGGKSWGAYVPDLPGCVAVGETEQEAKQLIQEAIEFHLEGLTQAGVPIPRQYLGAITSMLRPNADFLSVLTLRR